jgi:hypothetical protein
MKNSLYDVFCDKIISLDKKIRFVGFANESGVMLANTYRSGLSPLLTTEETSHYAIQAVTKATMREDFTAKLGSIEYSVTKNQRLIRALIPI